MAPLPVFVAAGAVIGMLTGFFGAGGSSIATPLLSVLGVPGLLAVASPLPATVPAALPAAVPYLRGHEARPGPLPGRWPAAFPPRSPGRCCPRSWAGRAAYVSGVVLMVVGSG